MEGVGDGGLYLLIHCRHQNESHFNVSLIVRDKVTRQRPQTTNFLKREESRNRIVPRSFCLRA